MDKRTKTNKRQKIGRRHVFYGLLVLAAILPGFILIKSSKAAVLTTVTKGSISCNIYDEPIMEGVTIAGQVICTSPNGSECFTVCGPIFDTEITCAAGYEPYSLPSGANAGAWVCAKAGTPGAKTGQTSFVFRATGGGDTTTHQASTPATVTTTPATVTGGSVAYEGLTCTSTQNFTISEKSFVEQALCVEKSGGKQCSFYCITKEPPTSSSACEIRCPDGYVVYHQAQDEPRLYAGYYCATAGTSGAFKSQTYSWCTVSSVQQQIQPTKQKTQETKENLPDLSKEKKAEATPKEESKDKEKVNPQEKLKKSIEDSDAEKSEEEEKTLKKPKKKRRAPPEISEDVKKRAKRYFKGDIADDAYLGNCLEVTVNAKNPKKYEGMLTLLDIFDNEKKLEACEWKKQINELKENVPEEILERILALPLFCEPIKGEIETWIEETYREKSGSISNEKASAYLDDAENRNDQACFLAKTVKFKDTPMLSWFFSYFNRQDQIFIKGYKDESGNLTGEGRPANTMLKMEFLVAILRALESEGSEGNCALRYQVKNAPEWATCAVNTAGAKGRKWTKGEDLSSPLKREEAALWITELSGLKKGKAEIAAQFNDCSKYQNFLEAVGTVFEHSIMTGYEDKVGQFGCGNTLNRAEATKVLLEMRRARAESR